MCLFKLYSILIIFISIQGNTETLTNDLASTFKKLDYFIIWDDEKLTLCKKKPKISNDINNKKWTVICPENDLIPLDTLSPNKMNDINLTKGNCNNRLSISHPNGGGMIEVTALKTVDAKAQIDSNSAICGNAIVKGDKTIIKGTKIQDNSVISNSIITSSSVSGHSKVLDSSLISTTILDKTQINHSTVTGAELSGNSIIDKSNFTVNNNRTYRDFRMKNNARITDSQKEKILIEYPNSLNDQNDSGAPK